jgi:hypothetical protein
MQVAALMFSPGIFIRMAVIEPPCEDAPRIGRRSAIAYTGLSPNVSGRSSAMVVPVPRPGRIPIRIPTIVPRVAIPIPGQPNRNPRASIS